MILWIQTLLAGIFRWAFAPEACIPCTGDDFPMYAWLAVMGLALIALIAAVIYFCKSMKK